MPLYNQPNLTSGIDDAIVTTIAEVPIFTPMMLLFIFCVIFIGGAINQKLRHGWADLPMWANLASMSILVISLLMTLREGLIQLEVLSIVVAITIVSGFWLYFDKNRNEV